MLLKNKFLDERKLEIYEEDFINNTEVLVLIVYCVKRDGRMWEMPATQIVNENLYNKYKDKYDEQVTAFRNDCSGTSDASLIENRFENIESQMEIIKTAFDELLLGGGV